MAKLFNRVKMTTATTGTGTITLGSASSGYQSFAAAGAVNADVVNYVIEDGTAWEIGTGTYTTTGTTLSRTLVQSSTGSLLTLSGSATVMCDAFAADVMPIVDYQEYLSSSTWTKPSGASWVYVEAIGAGGSGAKASVNGNGGYGGGFNCRLFRASDLTATVSATIGAGGAAVSVTATGNNGGDTTFGSFLTAKGGSGGGVTNATSGDGVVQFSTANQTKAMGSYGSGAGGVCNGAGCAGGNSVKGGAGGGGADFNSSAGAGGTSVEGGNGGAGTTGGAATAGSQPGGGGGGCGGGTSSGAGGAGRIRVWSW